ncbi:hypothetical protein IWQ62_003905 [Dispira parvispora]|uniref:Wsc domain-containing protein n=1 Tax=Dispira parvispora TaxID=1520584 RepID=A0A9W8AMM7_9FUNG|nr:hypothetical protein IWQ62_003905 [Dispira parvispora]
MDPSYRPVNGSIRTPYHLAPRDIINAAANQLLYSQYYTFFYVGLGVLSLISLIVALSETCPSTAFIILESIICFAMTVEVATRIVALGKLYWTSTLNIVDIILVVICVILLFLLSNGCSTASVGEELFNTVILLLRNCVQIFRVAMMIRQNQRHMDARDVTVQFDDHIDIHSDEVDEFGFPTGPGLQEIIAVNDDDLDNLDHHYQPDFHAHRGYTSASKYGSSL